VLEKIEPISTINNKKNDGVTFLERVACIESNINNKQRTPNDTPATMERRNGLPIVVRIVFVSIIFRIDFTKVELYTEHHVFNGINY